MSARTVTVFGEVYEARFPFLTTVTRLGSVAILKFLISEKKLYNIFCHDIHTHTGKPLAANGNEIPLVGMRFARRANI